MISLQFSTQDNPLSAAIRAFDHGWCSHVDAIMPDGTLLGARDTTGVKALPAGYAAFTRIERVDLPADPDTLATFLNFMKSQDGKPYDFSAILAFAFDRTWDEPDSWFCSELVAAALEAAKFFPWKLSTPTNRITPSDLLLACSVTVNLN